MQAVTGKRLRPVSYTHLDVYKRQLVIRSPYRPHSSDPLLGEPFGPPFPGGRFSSPFSPRCVYEVLHAGGLPGAVCCVIWFFYCKR